jgi:hypothetical protein
MPIETPSKLGSISKMFMNPDTNQKKDASNKSSWFIPSYGTPNQY